MNIFKYYNHVLCIPVFLDPMTLPLAREASNRLLLAFRPKTRSTYTRMYQDFLAFLVFWKLPVNQVNTSTLLAYMEYLVHNGYSHTNIANNISAIKSRFVVYGLNTTQFQDNRIALFLKSVKNNAIFAPDFKPLIDIDTLANIPLLAAAMPHPLVFKTLYLFCFFFFPKDFKCTPPHSRFLRHYQALG